jgi:hypothetical protein
MSILGKGASAGARMGKAMLRPLAANNYKGFFFGMVGAGVAIGLAGKAIGAGAPYVKQYIADWGLQQNKLGQGYINTNRDPWMGTKGSQAPMGATGDLALAASRLRNRSY